MKNLLIISISFMSLSVFSQEKFETNRKGSDYKFKVLKDLEATRYVYDKTCCFSKI